MDKPLTKKQKDFLKVLKAKACNISSACEAFGIDRTTHYEWLSNPTYPTYKKEYESIKESLIDFAESQLLKNIQNGKEASLIFFLKCRAKHRGYLERENKYHEASGLIDENRAMSEEQFKVFLETVKNKEQKETIVVQLD